MDKDKLMLRIAGDLRALADSIEAACEAMAGEDPQTAPAKKLGSEHEAKAENVTLEQVRAVLADKSQDGFTAEVRGLLEKHGAKKLSEIDPADYAALLAEAKELGNG